MTHESLTHTDLWNEIHSVKKEWGSFKSRLNWVLIGCVAAFVGYGVWVGTIQNKILNNQDDIQDNKTQAALALQSAHLSEVTLAEIKARLTNIETLLVELKNIK